MDVRAEEVRYGNGVAGDDLRGGGPARARTIFDDGEFEGSIVIVVGEETAEPRIAYLLAAGPCLPIAGVGSEGWR